MVALSSKIWWLGYFTNVRHFYAWVEMPEDHPTEGLNVDPSATKHLDSAMQSIALKRRRGIGIVVTMTNCHFRTLTRRITGILF